MFSDPPKSRDAINTVKSGVNIGEQILELLEKILTFTRARIADGRCNLPNSNDGNPRVFLLY